MLSKHLYVMNHFFFFLKYHYFKIEIIPFNIFNHGFIAVSFSYKNKKEQKKGTKKSM